MSNPIHPKSSNLEISDMKSGELVRHLSPICTNADRRHLKSLGHHLSPIVHIGKSGVTDGTTEALEEALEDHELVKIRILDNCPDELSECAAAIHQNNNAQVAQLLGNTILVYRKRKKKPAIKLPSQR